MDLKSQSSDRTEAVIRVKGLSAGYGSWKVLEDISFDVFPGEIFTIVGTSGCGKTTLLKNLIGLARPDKGSIQYWGREITGLDEEELGRLRKKIGVSFQSNALFNSITVAGNVALPLEEDRGIDRENIPIISRMKLSLVGLGDAGFMMPDSLSGGMKKRVAFARAVVFDPEIVFFDEPSSGLDPVTAAGLDRLILRLRDLFEITLVVVTHDLASIRAIADRVLMLDNGKIIFCGGTAEAERSPNPRLREFFGRRAESAESPGDIEANTNIREKV